MATTVTATFDGSVLRPDEPLDLRANTRYVITIETEAVSHNDGDAWDVLDSLIGTIEAPADWAAEHDHYLYGTPKSTGHSQGES